MLEVTDTSDAEAISRAWKVKRAQATTEKERQRVEKAHTQLLSELLSRRLEEGADPEVAFADRTASMPWKPRYAEILEKDRFINLGILLGCAYYMKTSAAPTNGFIIAVAAFGYRTLQKLGNYIQAASEDREEQRQADSQKFNRLLVLLGMFAAGAYAVVTYGLPMAPALVPYLLMVASPGPNGVLYLFMSAALCVAATFFR